MSKTPKIEKKPQFHASIKVMNRTFEAEGRTVQEAIEKLEPGIAKGMSILTLSKGKNFHSQVLTNIQTQRLFNLSPMMREVAIKQTSLLFDI